jgi:NAD(P)-dependent dehydrogenase (short-subunit alcohol dehydrogenase family)
MRGSTRRGDLLRRRPRYKPEETSEALERAFVLNYLSRYLLSRRLLPALAAAPSGRLVLVANAGRYRDTLNFDDLQPCRGKPGLAVAGRTQFANDLFAVELAERVADTRVQVTCVDPGMVKTDVFRKCAGGPVDCCAAFFSSRSRFSLSHLTSPRRRRPG